MNRKHVSLIVLLVIVIVFTFVYAGGFIHVDGFKNRPLFNIGINLNDIIIADSTDIVGTMAFTTTETVDTLVNGNFESTDFFFITQRTASPDAQDVGISYYVVDDTLFLERPASGQSGLTVNWFRVVGK